MAEWWRCCHRKN